VPGYQSSDKGAAFVVVVVNVVVVKGVAVVVVDAVVVDAVVVTPPEFGTTLDVAKVDVVIGSSSFGSLVQSLNFLYDKCAAQHV